MDNLPSSIKLGDLRLKNRIVLPPMQTSKAGEDGEVTDELIDHYGQYSKDVGLIVVEHSFVSLEGRSSPNQLGIDKESLLPGLEKLAETAKKGGAGAIIQLNHAGLKSDGTRLNLLDHDYEGSLSKYSREELERIVESFVGATRKAMKAGFDGVEIHGAHGFLLSEFVSQITNDREDEYGGDLGNRIKFPLKIVKRVRKELDGVLSYRLGATDLDPRGWSLEDAKTLAKKLDDLDVDLFDVSGGLCGDSPEELGDEQGYFVPHAEEIRKVVSSPVVGVGGITDPGYANDLVRTGRLDLIAVGRAQYKDPSWAAKAIKELN